MLSRVGLAAVGMGALTLAASAPAQAADPGTFSCRASVVRVEGRQIPVPKIEPLVANTNDAPCAPQATGLIPSTTAGPVTLAVAEARTTLTPGNQGAASASVAHVALDIGSGVPFISADVLTTRAATTCTAGAPGLSGESHVARVQIGTTVIDPVPKNQAIPLGPLGNIFLNHEIVAADGSRITERAIDVDTTLISVVIAESTADFTGNPCQEQPQCPDPNNPDCPPQCPDPNNPDCPPQCPDPNNPDCPPQCPDPNNPDCPPECPDANNPDCPPCPDDSGDDECPPCDPNTQQCPCESDDSGDDECPPCDPNTQQCPCESDDSDDECPPCDPNTQQCPCESDDSDDECPPCDPNTQQCPCESDDSDDECPPCDQNTQQCPCESDDDDSCQPCDTNGDENSECPDDNGDGDAACEATDDVMASGEQAAVHSASQSAHDDDEEECDDDGENAAVRA